MLVALVAVLVGRPDPSDGADRASAQDGRTTHVVHLRAGAVRNRFVLRRDSGVVLSFRLTLPAGSRASVSGEIAGVAGVRLSTDERGTCRRHGRVLLCRQGVEWCPLPAARWRFTLHKLSGPAGTARLEFIVGPPPR